MLATSTLPPLWGGGFRVRHETLNFMHARSLVKPWRPWWPNNYCTLAHDCHPLVHRSCFTARKRHFTPFKCSSAPVWHDVNTSPPVLWCLWLTTEFKRTLHVQCRKCVEMTCFWTMVWLLKKPTEKSYRLVLIIN